MPRSNDCASGLATASPEGSKYNLNTMASFSGVLSGVPVTAQPSQSLLDNMIDRYKKNAKICIMRSEVTD